MPYSSTTISKLLSIIFAVLVAQSLDAATPTTIRGSAPGFAGLEARIEIWADPISRSPLQSDSAPVMADGQFELHVAHSDTTIGVLSLRRFSAPIYLTPGCTYIIEITDQNEAPLLRTWQKGELQYLITEIYDAQQKSVLQEEINGVIGAVDKAYFRFFTEYADLIGTRAMPSHIHAFEEEQSAGHSPNSYAGKYVTYTAGEMRLACGLPRKPIYDSLLKESPVMVHHSGWFAFFSLFYDSYFENFSNRFGGQEMYNRLDENFSFDALDSLIQKDDFAQRTELRHLLLLHSISRAYFNNRYDRPSLLHIISAMAASEQVSEDNRKIASRLQERLLSTGLGANYSALKLDVNRIENTPTLLFISAQWSTTAEKEAMALHTLVNKYGAHFNVIEVWIENQEESAAKNARPWPVAFPRDVSIFMDQMSVYRIPQFAWVDSSGKIAANNMSPPSDRLEKVLFKLKADAERAQKLQIGQ